MNNIGLKIKLLREEKILSQEKLASHLDISQACLCRIESGKTDKIDFVLMQKICDFFSVNFDYFLENKISSNNKNSTISTLGGEKVNDTTYNLIQLILQNQKQIIEMISQQGQLIEKIVNKS